MSTSAGIFFLYWCNIQSPATVRQQTYKWGTQSDGWSWMSISLYKHYTSHHLSLREMCKHSLQDNKNSIISIIFFFLNAKVSVGLNLSSLIKRNHKLVVCREKKKHSFLLIYLYLYYFFLPFISFFLLNEILYRICIPHFERDFCHCASLLI